MGVLLYRLDRVDRPVNRGSYLFFSHCPNLSHSLKFNSWPSHSNSVTIPVDRVGPDLSTTVGQKKNTIFPLPIFRDCTECPSNYKTNYIYRSIGYIVIVTNVLPSMANTVLTYRSLTVLH